MLLRYAFQNLQMVFLKLDSSLGSSTIPEVFLGPEVENLFVTDYDYFVIDF